MKKKKSFFGTAKKRSFKGIKKFGEGFDKATAKIEKYNLKVKERQQKQKARMLQADLDELRSLKMQREKAKLKSDIAGFESRLKNKSKKKDDFDVFGPGSLF